MANNTVDIDRVYQKVQALANKDQRGYITPQEFNLFADQAQLEVFENYFHDLKMAQLKPKNSTDIGDEIELLNERISVHRVDELINESHTNNEYTLTDNAYILSSVFVSNIEVDEVDSRLLRQMERNPLTKAVADRPVYVRKGVNKIKIYPTVGLVVNVEYIKKPNTPSWGYVVIQGKALYNGANSTDFDLHESEETNLVMRILELSGIALKDRALTETAMRDKANTKAEKNN